MLARCYGVQVHYTLSIYKDDDKVVKKTVWGSSDWVLYKRGNQFCLADRRKLQQQVSRQGLAGPGQLLTQ